MRVAGLALLLALTGCANTSVSTPQTAGQVDLQRYQGTWYELARLPMFFQRHCAQSEARYRLQGEVRVEVINRCRTGAGEWLDAQGYAEPQQAGHTDKLWVRFDNWFSKLFPGVAKGDYWVLYLDADYSMALVGNPNRKYLWLLARTPEVSEAQRLRLLQEAAARGYDTSGLIWRQPDQNIAQ